MIVNNRLVRLGMEWIRGFFELNHYGTKGMKWGVRNGPPYPINKDGVYRNLKTVNIVSANGVRVTTFSKHVADRINENRPDRKVTTSDIIDSIKNPFHICDVRVDGNGQKSQRFIEKKQHRILILKRESLRPFG